MPTKENARSGCNTEGAKGLPWTGGIHSITDVNEAHRLARTHDETAVQYAIRCGELLAERKREEPGFLESVCGVEA